MKGPFKRTEGFIKPRRVDYLPGNHAIFEKRGDVWTDRPPKQPSVPPKMTAATRAIEQDRQRNHHRDDIPQFIDTQPRVPLPSKFYALERKGTTNNDLPVFHPALAPSAKSHKTHEREWLEREDRSSKPGRPKSQMLERAKARLRAIREEQERKADYVEIPDKEREPTVQERAEQERRKYIWQKKG